MDANNPRPFMRNFVFTGSEQRIIDNVTILFDQGARGVMGTKLQDDSDASIMNSLDSFLQDPDLHALPKGVLFQSAGSYAISPHSSKSRANYKRDMRASADTDVAGSSSNNNDFYFPPYVPGDFDEDEGLGEFQQYDPRQYSNSEEEKDDDNELDY
jgi:hypothetical protein